MTLRHLLVTLLLIFSISPAFAQTALQPVPKVMVYKIAWNGIKLGRIIIEAEQSNFSYHMSIDTKTTGMVNMFSPLKSVIWASGRIYEGQIIPQKYNSRSASDEGDKDSTHELTYDEDGLLVDRVSFPPNDPSWRPDVPLDEARDAYDPVTAFFVLREKLFLNVNHRIKDTQITTYDGRRLAEFTFKAVNNGTKMRNGKVVPVINTVVFRKPINGYTPKELKKFDEGDPKIHAYFSADRRFVPLEFEIYHWSGKITASLDE